MPKAISIQAPGAAPFAPPYVDFAQTFAADPNVVGVWRTDDTGQTYDGAGPFVRSFANVKLGGPALSSIAAGQAEGVLNNDPVLGRNVLQMTAANAVQYFVPYDTSSSPTFTGYAYVKPVDFGAYANFSYLMHTDDETKNFIVARYDKYASPTNYPIMSCSQSLNGTETTRADLVELDPYAWQEVFPRKSFDSSVNLAVVGAGTTRAAGGVGNPSSTYFCLGAGTPSRTPSALVAVFALFRGDIEDGSLATTRATFAAFRREVCRLP